MGECMYYFLQTISLHKIYVLPLNKREVSLPSSAKIFY